MTEYEVEYAEDLQALSKLIAVRLAAEWKPQGGVSSYLIHQRDGSGNQWVETWFMQAVVR